MNEAKETFLKYGGSYFHIERDGNLSKYKAYNVDAGTEREWLKEYQEEIIIQIQAGNSIDVYLSRLCRVMFQIKDDEYLEKIFNILSKVLEESDTFIRLRVAEELQKMIIFFRSNDIGDIKKLANYKNQTIDILRKIISQPLVISKDTRRKVVFEDTLKEETIKERAKQRLEEFKQI